LRTSRRCCRTLTWRRLGGSSCSRPSTSERGRQGSGNGAGERLKIKAELQLVTLICVGNRAVERELVGGPRAGGGCARHRQQLVSLAAAVELRRGEQPLTSRMSDKLSNICTLTGTGGCRPRFWGCSQRKTPLRLTPTRAAPGGRSGGNTVCPVCSLGL
jgi:hypothetical protein